MDNAQLEALHVSNADQLARMNPAAAGLVSALLDELERNGRLTFIQLRNAAVAGHRVEYDFVSGDRTLVAKLAKQLTFKTATENALEVRGGR